MVAHTHTYIDAYKQMYIDKYIYTISIYIHIFVCLFTCANFKNAHVDLYSNISIYIHILQKKKETNAHISLYNCNYMRT